MVSLLRKVVIPIQLPLLFYSRLITGEADKSIKIYKEDESATPETHPIDIQSREELEKAF